MMYNELLALRSHYGLRYMRGFQTSKIVSNKNDWYIDNDDDNNLDDYDDDDWLMDIDAYF